MKILIAESDQALGQFLQRSLESEGYAMAVQNESSLIIPTLLESHYQVLILDADMLRVQGAPVLAELLATTRRVCPELAVMILSSRTSVEERVMALDAGAEDFVGKPFSYFELAARIRVLFRRRTACGDLLLQAGDLIVNRLERSVTRSGRPVELTAREYRLLEFLMCNYGRQVSRTAILQHVWEAGSPLRDFHPAQQAASDGGEPGAASVAAGQTSMTNIVDVYINYLRQKLGDSREKRLIHTVRGIGYQLGSSELHTGEIHMPGKATLPRTC